MIAYHLGKRLMTISRASRLQAVWTGIHRSLRGTSAFLSWLRCLAFTLLSHRLMWLAALYAETSPQVVDLNVLRRVAAQGMHLVRGRAETNYARSCGRPAVGSTIVMAACSHSKPTEPSLISCRMMLNTLPADRALWTEHNTRKRDEYYVRACTHAIICTSNACFRP